MIWDNRSIISFENKRWLRDEIFRSRSRRHFRRCGRKAYLTTQPDSDIVFDYHPTFDQVYQAVSGDNIGLLPLENQLDGYVSATLQRLQSADVTEIGEITIPVNFGLVANVADLKQIKQIYVQFKTEGQCQKLLSSLPQAQIVTTSSNMVSLEKFQSGEPGSAAIIPQSQMAVLKQPLMLDKVADQDDNSTRFIILNPGLPILKHFLHKPYPIRISKPRSS